MFNVLYAGLSKTSIRSRFLVHCNKPDENIREAKKCYAYRTGKMSFYYARAAATSVADIENRLIDCFGPPCNRQAGTSPVITANLGDGRPAG